ncbi:MAG: signal peptidase II [Ignavibacteria bacterium]|nr:signal peptidase II [Ignavibacteria bacterium]
MKILYFTLVLVLGDQITKFLVKGINLNIFGLIISLPGMSYGSSIPIIDNIFFITFIENPGMAFGMEFGGRLGRSLFTIVASILIIYFIYLNRKEGYYLKLSLSFILAGALGNLIDRAFYGLIYDYAPLFQGKVVDFFQINIPDITIFGKTFTSWPIFNLADLYVTTGFLMIILGYRKIFHKKIKEEIIDDKNLSPINKEEEKYFK